MKTRRMTRERRELRETLWQADPTCRYCNRHLPALKHCTLDHLLPRSRGGDDSADNLVLCCYDCNVAKRDRLPGELLAWSLRIAHVAAGG